MALAEAGADVAVNYRERGQNAQAVADAISKLGRRSAAIRADVSDGDAVKSMMGSIQAQLGPVDVLVNNAGVALHRGLDDLTEADFDRTIAVNLKSAFLCTQDGNLSGYDALATGSDIARRLWLRRSPRLSGVVPREISALPPDGEDRSP